MISPRRLLQMARKWQKIASRGRRRISWWNSEADTSLDAGSAPLAASKGNFVVYSLDGWRFAVPLEYINTSIFMELFEISKEEFGLPCDGPIVMPCDAVSMEYVISMLRRRVSKDVEKALVNGVVGIRCSMSSVCSQGFAHPQLLVHGF